MLSRTAYFGNPGNEAVTLHYPKSRNARRFALVSKVLSAMGVYHAAVIPLMKRRKQGALVKAAIDSDYCRVVMRQPPSCRIVIAEKGGFSKRNTSGGQKRLVLTYDTRGFLASPDKANILFHPILFHPNMISAEKYEEAKARAANTQRPIGILFAGNCDAATYTRSDMASEYGLFNRVEIFQMAIARAGKQLFAPEDRSQFETALENGELEDRLVWIDTQKFEIPQANWLELISKSRFFVCTPGVKYPYCQNLNESASCGSVPILQFPDAYYPPLEDGVNCLSFSDGDGFAETVETALSLPDAQWKGLSASAVTYHDSHLSLESLCRKLSNFFDDENRGELIWVMAGKE